MTNKKKPLKELEASKCLTNASKSSYLASVGNAIRWVHYSMNVSILSTFQCVSVTGCSQFRSHRSLNIGLIRDVFRLEVLGRSLQIPIFQATNGSDKHFSREFKEFKALLGFLCSKFTNKHIVKPEMI